MQSTPPDRTDDIVAVVLRMLVAFVIVTLAAMIGFGMVFTVVLAPAGG